MSTEMELSTLLVGMQSRKSLDVALVVSLISILRKITHYYTQKSATTDAQLSCMKAVPFRKLEDAVISTNAGFLPSFDSESPLFLRHHLNPSVAVQT